MDEDSQKTPAIMASERVTRIGKRSSTGTELEESQGQACGNVNTPTTSVYKSPREYKELIDSYSTFNQSMDEEVKRLPLLNLGCAFYSLGEYKKAVTCFEGAAKQGEKLNDKEMLITAYVNLTSTAKAFGSWKLHDYCKKGLNVIEEDKDSGPNQCSLHVLYNKQGMLYHNVAAYEKSLKCHQRGLQLSVKFCDKPEEALSHHNLTTVYCTIGHYENAREHNCKYLEISMELGDRLGESVSYIQLAYLCYIRKEYEKAIDYQSKALAVIENVGTLEIEATSCGNLSLLYRAVGDHEKSAEVHEKCRELRMGLETLKMDRAMGNHRMATECKERSFSIAEGVGEFTCGSSNILQQESFQIIEVMRGNSNDFFLVPRALFHTAQLNTKAFELYTKSIKGNEHMRHDLDYESKDSLDGQTFRLYKTRSLLSWSSDPKQGLLNLEKGRAPVLADFIRKTYGYQTSPVTPAFGNDASSIIDSLIEKQKCDFLVFTYFMKNLVTWFVDVEGTVTKKQYSETDPLISSTQDLLQTLTEEVLETKATKGEGKGNKGEDKERKKKRDSNLQRLFEVLIAPICGLIKSPEVVVVSDGHLFKVLFAALKDKKGVYLSNEVRIRIVPSLMVLKLIQDAPAHHHSKTGAFIIGVPDLEDEVREISKLFNQPYLLGKQADKEAVLHGIQEPVSVIHLALAAFSGNVTGNATPIECEDLVTVEDIRKLQIKAPLVVLSDHSGLKGERFAHALLGSGARAVLVCLCPVRKDAVSNFMNFFYMNLVGKNLSASKALNKAQQQMREKGFQDEKDWASFVLIGDDVKDVATDKQAVLREGYYADLFSLEKDRAPVLVDAIRKTYGYQTSSATTAPEIDKNGVIVSLIEKQKCDFLVLSVSTKILVIHFVDKEGAVTKIEYSETHPLFESTQDLLQTLTEEVMDTMRKEGQGNEDDNKRRKEKRDLNLRTLFKILIAPIRSFIKSPELVVVPEGHLFNVFFAALKDEKGVYLFKKVRLRIIYSLTVLKLIQDAPANYHSKTGAFIVGVKDLGLKEFHTLPYVENEVRKIAKLLNQPYLHGKQATKEAVLRGIQGPVRMILIATHGTKKGEPVFVPPPFENATHVKRDDVVVTRENVSDEKITALLVVLNFCLALGIAPAFLGSGARAVLACLCPVRDFAAANFCNLFFKNLMEEKMSASEALNKAQQEMEKKKFQEKDWAPFVLIGDNVSFATD